LNVYGTLPSLYWVICLSWIFSCGGCRVFGWVTPSRIQSSGKGISFHLIDLGTIVFDLARSIWRSNVSTFWDWNLCLRAKGEHCFGMDFENQYYKN